MPKKRRVGYYKEKNEKRRKSREDQLGKNVPHQGTPDEDMRTPEIVARTEFVARTEQNVCTP
jgi:hypothetical protein